MQVCSYASLILIGAELGGAEPGGAELEAAHVQVCHLQVLSREQLRLYDSSRQLVQVLQKALEGLASLSPRPGGNAGRRSSSGTGDAVVAQAKGLVTTTGSAPHFSEQGGLGVITGCYARSRLVGWLWTGSVPHYSERKVGGVWAASVLHVSNLLLLDGNGRCPPVCRLVHGHPISL